MTASMNNVQAGKKVKLSGNPKKVLREFEYTSTGKTEGLPIEIYGST
jgi:hypothetical protein